MHRKSPAQSAVKTAGDERILPAWVELGRPVVDAQVLADLVKRLGNDSISPATMARLLADEGAELRHPEVIEFDAQWREAQLATRGEKFAEISQLVSAGRLSLDRAEALISKLETLRLEFESTGDQPGQVELRGLALETRQRAQAMAKSRRLSDSERAEQLEIDEWIKVWLQTPALFKDWLELRRRSEEFRSKFPNGS